MLLSLKAYFSSPLLIQVKSSSIKGSWYLRIKKSKTVFINHSQNLNKRDVLTLFITKGNSQHTKHFISDCFLFSSFPPFLLFFAESSIWELYLFTKVIFKFVKIATSRQLYCQQYCHIKNIIFVTVYLFAFIQFTFKFSCSPSSSA